MSPTTPTAETGRIEAGVHRLPLRVYYEDTDAGGIVYHANHLKFAERARTEMLRTRGFDHQALAEEHDLVFAVARSTIDFVAPARLDDLLAVRTRVLRIGGVRLELEQLVCRAQVLIARLEFTLALLERSTLRPKRMPEALRQGFVAASTPA
jgi:acyl-CoA thioester hydrolase